MHELIQDVAYEILSQEIKNGDGRRLCDTHYIQHLLQDEETKSNGEHSLVLEGIESILLYVSGLSFVINPVALKSMCNLRLLKIYSSDPIKYPGLGLQKGHFSLPCELQLLHWEKLPFDNLAKRF
ncbi:unnamed protein product [Arabis nemorensis]|uniref:Uncharacterized protein n=1 Tax=Arabis nemorensis TaxID=586526 RepID=A0A565C571_9BRAS|nr:unnamed protein product [Arabis nemorensis]